MNNNRYRRYRDENEPADSYHSAFESDPVSDQPHHNDNEPSVNNTPPFFFNLPQMNAAFSENRSINELEKLMLINKKQSETIEQLQKRIQTLQEENEKFMNATTVYETINSKMKKQLEEMSNKHMQDGALITEARYEKGVQEVNAKSALQAYHKLLNEYRACTEKINELRGENNYLKTQIETYNTRKRQKQDEFLNNEIKRVNSLHEQAQKDYINSQNELNRTRIDMLRKQGNLQMKDQIFNIVVQQFSDYREAISEWIDVNWKSYYNYIQSISNASKTNYDIIEKLLHLVDELEKWIVDIIYDYEHERVHPTNKTKTTIKSEVAEERNEHEENIDARIPLPEKPTIIQPMIPPNVSSSVNMYNALS